MSPWLREVRNGYVSSGTSGHARPLKIVVDATAEKIKGALQPKDESSKIVLPPGTDTDK